MPVAIVCKGEEWKGKNLIKRCEIESRSGRLAHLAFPLSEDGETEQKTADNTSSNDSTNAHAYHRLSAQEVVVLLRAVCTHTILIT
jgi:hypothetical protein